MSVFLRSSVLATLALTDSVSLQTHVRPFIHVHYLSISTQCITVYLAQYVKNVPGNADSLLAGAQHLLACM